MATQNIKTALSRCYSYAILSVFALLLYLSYLSLLGTKSNPAVLKYFDYEKEREIMETVPEMIPEFVVPDLTGFKVCELKKLYF